MLKMWDLSKKGNNAALTCKKGVACICKHQKLKLACAVFSVIRTSFVYTPFLTDVPEGSTSKIRF